MAQATPSQPAEQASVPETKEEDIERRVTWENHRNFCQNRDMIDRLVIMKHMEHGYCKLESTGRKRWVKTIASAQRFEVGSRFIQTKWTWGDSTIELLLIKEAPQVPGCKLTDWFDGGFITLMNDAPNNAVMRAHMMRVLKIEPARELDTFEKLKDWVEKTFPKPRRNRHNPPPGFEVVDLGDLAVPMPTRPRTPRVEIGYRMNEREHGRCSYSVDKSASVTLELTIDMIREGTASGEIEGMGSLVEYARERAREMDDIDWDYGEHQTRDSEPDDSDDFRITLRDEFPHAEVANMIRMHAPELLEQLGL